MLVIDSRSRARTGSSEVNWAGPAPRGGRTRVGGNEEPAENSGRSPPLGLGRAPGTHPARALWWILQARRAALVRGRGREKNVLARGPGGGDGPGRRRCYAPWNSRPASFGARRPGCHPREPFAPPASSRLTPSEGPQPHLRCPRTLCRDRRRCSAQASARAAGGVAGPRRVVRTSPLMASLTSSKLYEEARLPEQRAPGDPAGPCHRTCAALQGVMGSPDGLERWVRPPPGRRGRRRSSSGRAADS